MMVFGFHRPSIKSKVFDGYSDALNIDFSNYGFDWLSWLILIQRSFPMTNSSKQRKILYL